MSDVDDAAAALSGFVAISDDDPRVQEFRDAVIQDIAVRPSPVRAPESVDVRLSRLESRLDEIITMLGGRRGD
jgi:hypothetical protein